MYIDEKVGIIHYSCSICDLETSRFLHLLYLIRKSAF